MTIEGLSMWDSPAEEITLSRVGHAKALAEAAVEPLWPYLSKATSQTEFEHRLALSDSSITRLLHEAVVVDYGQPVDEVKMIATEHLAKRFEEALKAKQAEAEREAVAATLRDALAADSGQCTYDSGSMYGNTHRCANKATHVVTYYNGSGPASKAPVCDRHLSAMMGRYPSDSTTSEKIASRHTAGAISWQGDTHMGVGYLSGKAANGDIFEVYSNSNANPTPCSWVNYGPKGDTGPNSGIAEGHGFKSMQEAMADAEAHAAGTTASLHTAGDTAQVMAYPTCDVCKQNGVNTEARYDGKTVFGPWAYMCKAHFQQVGTGLGTGKGQKLVLAPSSKSSAKTAADIGDDDLHYQLGYADALAGRHKADIGDPQYDAGYAEGLTEAGQSVPVDVGLSDPFPAIAAQRTAEDSWDKDPSGDRVQRRRMGENGQWDWHGPEGTVTHSKGWRYHVKWDDGTESDHSALELGTKKKSSLHTAEQNPPYYIEQKDGKWVVVNDEGHVKGTFDSKEQARQQQKALYANVPGAQQAAEDKHGEPKPKVQSSLTDPDFQAGIERIKQSTDTQALRDMIAQNNRLRGQMGGRGEYADNLAQLDAQDKAAMERLKELGDDKPRTAVQALLMAEAAVEQLVYKAPSADQDFSNEGPDVATINSLVGKYVRVVFYNEHGVATDYDSGRFTTTPSGEVEWSSDANDYTHPIDPDSIYSITRLEEPVEVGHPQLFAAKQAVNVKCGNCGKVVNRSQAYVRGGLTTNEAGNTDWGQQAYCPECASDLGLAKKDAQVRVSALLGGATDEDVIEAEAMLEQAEAAFFHHPQSDNQSAHPNTQELDIQREREADQDSQRRQDNYYSQHPNESRPQTDYGSDTYHNQHQPRPLVLPGGSGAHQAGVQEDWPNGVPYECPDCHYYRNAKECTHCADRAKKPFRSPTPLDYIMHGLFPSGATAAQHEAADGDIEQQMYQWGRETGEKVRNGLMDPLGEVWQDGYGNPMEDWRKSDKSFPRGYRDGLEGKSSSRTAAEQVGDSEHGSDFRRFVPGAWPACKCGYNPKDNALLNAHFAEHGFKEVDEGGQIVRHPVEGGRHQAVNENAYGTERYQNQPPTPRPDWITDWDDDDTLATPEMTEQGMNAYVRKDNPLADTLTTVRQAALKIAADAESGWLAAARRVLANHQSEEVDGVLLDAQTANLLVQVYSALSLENQPKFAAWPLPKAAQFAWSRTSSHTAVDDAEIPRTTKPRQVPNSDQPDLVTVEDQIIPPDPPPLDMADPEGVDPTVEMGSGDFGGESLAPPVDPLSPTVDQMVAARVAALSRQIIADNPQMNRDDARALAARTIATFPQMVSVTR